nr:hypothetical protein [Tanacetum cinerariifolium]
MATTIDHQIALDEFLVPSTQRLRIGRSNLQLPSDIKSKESTLQVVYDVLNSIRFKIDTKKSVLDLEAFREMLHISPRIPSQSFVELPSEEEILDFLRFLGHSHEIRYLMDVNKKGDSASSITPPTPTPTTIVVSTPRLSATAKGKQPTRAITPTEPTDVQGTEAKQLKIALKRSRQETHISQQRSSSTDEGTGS